MLSFVSFGTAFACECSKRGRLGWLTHPFATSIPSPVPNVGDLTNSVRAVAHGTKEAFSESLSTKKVVRVLAARENETTERANRSDALFLLAGALKAYSSAGRGRQCPF